MTTSAALDTESEVALRDFLGTVQLTFPQAAAHRTQVELAEFPSAAALEPGYTWEQAVWLRSLRTVLDNPDFTDRQRLLTLLGVLDALPDDAPVLCGTIPEIVAQALQYLPIGALEAALDAVIAADITRREIDISSQPHTLEDLLLVIQASHRGNGRRSSLLEQLWGYANSTLEKLCILARAYDRSSHNNGLLNAVLDGRKLGCQIGSQLDAACCHIFEVALERFGSKYVQSL